MRGSPKLSAAHVHDACARLWRDVERARESLRVCISVGLLTASEEIVKEPRAKLASGGREGLETGVRSAGPFRPWVPEGGICAHVDQKAPPGYRTSGSAINLLRPVYSRMSPHGLEVCRSDGPLTF